MYDSRMEGLIHAALAIGGRREKLLEIRRRNVRIDDPKNAEVMFVHTKGKRDSRCPSCRRW